MHKLLLTGTLLMAVAATCFAQTTYQAGVAQKSVQTLIGSNQVSLIDQREGAAHNYGNMAVTTQSGISSNRVTINQTEGSASNYAEVTQADDAAQGTGGNLAFISQSNNSGAGNATVTVSSAEPVPGTRDGNYAFVRQVGHNTVTIAQDGGLFGISNGNVTTVDQLGEDHATITQGNGSFGNSVIMKQAPASPGLAGWGYATIEQTGGLTGRSEGNTATLEQQGQGSYGTISQNNLSLGNNAHIRQVSNGHMGTIIQSNDARNNDARITQQANTLNQRALITEADNSHNNVAVIDQSGLGSNNAQIDQTNHSKNNTASIVQGRTGLLTLTNMAKISQSNAYAVGGSGGNTAIIEQIDGTVTTTNNNAEVYQGRNAASAGIARIEALGVSSQNVVRISQHDADNSSKVYQVGNKQEATITQTGNRNLVKGTSLADFSNYATQYGVGNTLMINQMDGQTAGVFQYGTGNSGIINQSNN
ncbi:hypothetical protein [Fibrella aquatilis]|uniref:Curlin associated repeat-containing protein n=1 Tax=Fibrella aquatilis TaxID=2817059 RepID=A0A939G6E4_9BACT|nr:hypothetical protein [Fibrella aquatilis]MBO0932053.1 hypothetical protein [Fibrella aquatilis]